MSNEEPVGVMEDYPNLHNVCSECEIEMMIPGCQAYRAYAFGIKRPGEPCQTCFHSRVEHTCSRLNELVDGFENDVVPSFDEDELRMEMDDIMVVQGGGRDSLEDAGDDADDDLLGLIGKTFENNDFATYLEEKGETLEGTPIESQDAVEIEIDHLYDASAMAPIGNAPPPLPSRGNKPLRGQKKPAPKLPPRPPVRERRESLAGKMFADTPPTLHKEHVEEEDEDEDWGEVDDLAKMLQALEAKGDILGSRIESLHQRTSRVAVTTSDPDIQTTSSPDVCTACGGQCESPKFSICSSCRRAKVLAKKRRESMAVVYPLIKENKGFALENGLLKAKDDGRVRVEDDERFSPYYRHYFKDKAHEIYTCRVGDKNDPLLLAVELPSDAPVDEDMPEMPLRALVFSCKPLTKKVEDRWLFIPPGVSLQKAVKQAMPELGDAKFKRVIEPGFKEKLLEYEGQILSNTDRFKIGVLYITEDQTSDENAMFSNTQGSPQFQEFMDMLGDKITLRGWDKEKYSGGLNRTDDSTGSHAYYSTIRGLQIIFHVNTLLPHRDTDEQKLDKKRHIGNDVVVVVFCDSNTVVFDPMELHSQFNHVFIVVVPEEVNGVRHYRIAVSRKPGVPRVPPDIIHPALYEKGDIFREFLLTKMINAERKSMYAPQFVRKMYRTRLTLMSRLLEDAKLDSGLSVVKNAWSAVKGMGSLAKRDKTPQPGAEGRASDAGDGAGGWLSKLGGKIKAANTRSSGAQSQPQGAGAHNPEANKKKKGHKRSKSFNPKKKDEITK